MSGVIEISKISSLRKDILIPSFHKHPKVSDKGVKWKVATPPAQGESQGSCCGGRRRDWLTGSLRRKIPIRRPVLLGRNLPHFPTHCHPWAHRHSHYDTNPAPIPTHYHACHTNPRYWASSDQPDEDDYISQTRHTHQALIHYHRRTIAWLCPPGQHTPIRPLKADGTCPYLPLHSAS